MMKHNSLHDDPMSPSADLVLSKGLQDGLVIFAVEKGTMMLQMYITVMLQN